MGKKCHHLMRSRPSPAAASAGLAKFRPLHELPQPATDSNPSDLPSGWYLDEAKETKFWQDLEQSASHSRYGPSAADQQAKNMSDLGTSAGRIQALLQQFDQLDQDLIMELMRIVDESGNGSGDYDQFSMINDAKSSVLYNIDELREYAESESSLLETLKLWLVSTQQSMEVRAGGQIDAIPDLDFVYG
jgi:hypothetical protein